MSVTDVTGNNGGSMDKITVCDACLQASCWQGEFMCDKSRGAGTVEKSKAELERLGLEHPSYWNECYRQEGNVC